MTAAVTCAPCAPSVSSAVPPSAPARSRRPTVIAPDSRFEEYRGGIYGYLRRRGFSAEEADDLTQETFIRACAHLSAFRGASPAAWLYRIAGNLAIDHHRKRRVQTVSLEDPRAAEVVDDSASDPLERLTRGERRERVVELLNELPLKQRRLIWMRYFEERSLEEIAGAVGCTPGVAKQRVFRALAALRKRCRTAEPAGREP